MVKQCDSLAALKEELNAAGDKLVVVDFFATWCPPCKMIAPKLEEMSQSMANVVFLKVDVDQNDEASQHYGIEAMPTFLYFKSGKKVDTLTGANESKLKALVDKHSNSLGDKSSTKCCILM